MATSNLPRRSVSRVREGQRTSWQRNIFGRRERKAAGRRSFLLVRTSNILIGQWLYTHATKRYPGNNVYIFFSFSFSTCRNSSSLEVIALRTDNVGSRQQQQLRRGCCVARPRRRHRDSLSRRLWNSRGYRAPGDRAKMILSSANQCLCRAAKPRWWRLRVAKACASHR